MYIFFILFVQTCIFSMELGIAPHPSVDLVTQFKNDYPHCVSIGRQICAKMGDSFNENLPMSVSDIKDVYGSSFLQCMHSVIEKTQYVPGATPFVVCCGCFGRTLHKVHQKLDNGLGKQLEKLIALPTSVARTEPVVQKNLQRQNPTPNKLDEFRLLQASNNAPFNVGRIKNIFKKIGHWLFVNKMYLIYTIIGLYLSYKLDTMAENGYTVSDWLINYWTNKNG